MALKKSKTRMQSAMINILFIYTVLTLTGIVTWIHLRTQSVEQQVPQWSIITDMAGFKPNPVSGNHHVSLENTLEQSWNQTVIPKAGDQKKNPHKPQQLKLQQKRPNGNETKPTQIVKCSKASLTKYSKWFDKRFHPKTKIFMDKDDLKNFRRLSNRKLPNGMRGEKLKLLKNILLHGNFTNPPVHGPSKKPGCIRCAVVGSGGILNGSGVGEQIDRHDYVFRVNQADTSGMFTKDVGQRTTFYTFYPESQHFSKQDEDVIAFYTMFKTYDVEYALRMLNGENFTNTVSKNLKKGTKSCDIDPKRLKLVHPELFTYITQQFLARRFRPTTGALNVFIALHICDEVTIYGFGYNPQFSLHYYDKKFIKHQMNLTIPHDVAMERKLWLKLHEEGAIRLFKRDL